MLANGAAIAEHFKRDIEQAVHILQAAGCTEIYIFGSVATGEANDDSDIDIAIRGCPPEQFFSTLGQLMRDLVHPIDLIDLNESGIFVRHLLDSEELIRIA